MYRFNGTNWVLGPEIPDNDPTSAVAWNGALYWGMNSGGELYRAGQAPLDTAGVSFW